MSNKSLYLLLLFVFVLSGRQLFGQHISSVKRIIRFDHRLVNESDQSQDIEIFLSLPQSNERQEVRYVYTEPGYVEIIEDEYGNQLAHYSDKQVPAGEVVSHGWIAEVELHSYVYDGNGVKKSVPALSASDLQLYLADAPNYQITAPIISDLAQKLASGQKTDLEKVKNFFDYLIHEVVYERDLVWDPAPEVIRRKSGSCSEYNYAFLSLCRAANIPCRYSGGIVLQFDKTTRYDANMAEDAVFHRWSEVYLDSIGWFPIDCSRGSTEIRRYGNPYNQFGRLPASALQTMRGDGAGNSPLGWDYLSKEKVAFKTSGKDGKVGFWLNGVPDNVLREECRRIETLFSTPNTEIDFKTLVQSSLTRELVFLFRNQIRTQNYPHLIRALYEIHHPAVIYWTVLAQKRGIPVAFHQTYPFLCDGDLTRQIQNYLKGDRFDLLDFEYWWRKARPLLIRDEENSVFHLPEKELNLF